MVETKDDKRKRVSLHQNPYSRENGGGIEANSKEIITNDDYLFTRPIIVRFFADGTRPRSRSTVEERRLNEETALESGGWSGGKKSKKASG